MKEFIPSKEQKDFFEFIVNSNENAVLNAVAGSGKTTTLVKSIDYIPKEKTLLFTAFNKSIATELKERVSGENITVSTVHGIGYQILNSIYDVEIDNLKYNKLLYEIALNNQEALNKYKFNATSKRYINTIYNLINKKDIEIKQYNKNVISLINFGRLYYIDINNKTKGIKELNDLAKYHTVENNDDESFVAWHLIKIGLTITNKIDFTDMIYLPLVLDLKPQTYDFVYVDECVPVSTQILTMFGSVRLSRLYFLFNNPNKNPPLIVTYNEEKKIFENKKILNIWSNGIKEVYYVEINNKKKIKATNNHRFLTTVGWKRLDELKIGDVIVNDKGEKNTHITKEFTFLKNEEVFDMTVEDNHNFIITSPMSTYGVIAHNCQDLNTTQRMLIEKSKNENGRFVFVGDNFQQIYGFTGANTDSFNYLCNIPNTQILPLSVSYRCPPTIVDMVKHINPNIVSHTTTDNGKRYDSYSYKNLKDGDMVLCRETFPLVSLCVKLVSEGKKAFIIGSEIGLSICKMISDCEKKNEEFTMDNVFSHLYHNKNKLIEKLETTNHITKNEATKDSLVVLMDEKIKIIEALTNNDDNPSDVIKKIEKLFSDTDKTGIRLSTIHKSKGLESDRVFIIQQELLPSRFAKTDKELLQEENLRYVAITRSKRVIGFITDFDAFDKHESKQHKVREISESKHIGIEGSRMWLDLEIIASREINGTYGATIVYDLKDKQGNIFSKFGEIPRKFNNVRDVVRIGSNVSFYGIIKEHSTFNGKKINKLGKIFEH